MFGSRARLFALMGLSVGLLAAFASYSDDERNLLGPPGHFIASFAVDNLWGLSAYFFPLAGLWVAGLGLRRKLDLTQLFWQFAWGFFFLFSANLFLLNTPLINTHYAGLFTMVLHAFLLNLLGQDQGASLGSLVVEALFVAVAFVGCSKTFLPKGIVRSDQGRQASKRAPLKRMRLSRVLDGFFLSSSEVEANLLDEFPLFVRVRQNGSGLLLRYDSREQESTFGRSVPLPQGEAQGDASSSSPNIRRYGGDSRSEEVPEVVVPEPEEACSEEHFDIDLSLGGVMAPGEPEASEPDEDFSMSSSGSEAPEDRQVQHVLEGLKRKPLVFNGLGRGPDPKNPNKELRATLEALITNSSKVSQASDESINRTIRILEETTRQFGIESKVVAVSVGPVITQYELTVEPGVKISRIVNLSDNIALSLAAPSIRIVAPIPGKSVIGIEVPNQHRQMVALKDIVSQRRFQEAEETLPIALGKSIFGEPVIADLGATPHLLIAGATGSGKSVCVNAIICSLLLSCPPKKVRFLMIDPKMVELNVYNGIPHLLCPVITNPKKAATSLKWIIGEMESRYYLLERYGVRSIDSYNSMVEGSPTKGHPIGSLPYIVVVIDEFSDLMMLARKEVEDSISRLAAMSRAVGIHLILATQRPSVNVITGVIKANFPSRIAFQVSSRVDSRTILDDGGADKLLGKGDMLFRSVHHHAPERIQGNFLSDGEVNKIVDDLKRKSSGHLQAPLLELDDDEAQAPSDADDVDDVLYDEVVELIRGEKKVSASFLQRKLKIGYNRAARIVEIMEERGLVGPADGSKPREVYL